VVVAGAFLGLGVAIRGITRRFFVEELQRSQRAIVNLQHRSIEQLGWTSSVLTQSPTLRAAIETYRLESGAGRGLHAELLATIQDEVVRIVAGLGKDLLIVTDGHGRVLAASERGGARPAIGADLSTLPPVRRALDPSLPADSANAGVALIGGHYFQIGCVPIVLQGFAIGTLLLGDRLDAELLGRLRESVDGEIVVARPGEVIASTLAQAPEAAAVATAGTGGPGTIRAAGAEYVVAPLRLGFAPDGQPVTLYLLRSLGGALGPLNVAVRLDFILYGVLAVVFAGLGAVVVSRSLLAPLRNFVGFVESVADSGDYARRFDASRATAEIRTLDEAYDHLLESLDQKRTELEQRTEELRQSQKLEAIGTLAGGVAHDFNNLLTIILSYTDMVKAALGSGHELREDLEAVQQAADRAAGLTKQLLAFSRKQVLQPRLLDLNGVVAGVEKMLRRVIGEDIEMQTVAAAPLGKIKADPGQLEQVLLNLVVNARDAMPRGGRLAIETGNVHFASAPELLAPMGAGDWVLLTVSDTGVGMDDATRARIFEPFFTTKQPGKGTGLGLSTVYGIVKQSGGFVWVTSQPGHGTTFKIYFPKAVEEREAAREEAAALGGLRGAETVLLVEDEEPVRVLTRRCLEGYGYRVLTASHPDEAVRLADRHNGPIHLMLTDVIMPGESGRELAERLAPVRPEMRVLYMSGYTDDAVVHHGVPTAGIELLEKPFTPVELARRVRGMLDRPGTASPARAVAQ
jgi:signal transduction histidine kinase